MAIERTSPADLTDDKWLPDAFASSNVVDVLDTTYRLELGAAKETITEDNKTSGSSSSTNSLTWSHGVGSGSNRLLVVTMGISYSTPGTVSSVTYGGVALTRAITKSDGSRKADVWYLVNPAVGTNDVVVNTTGTGDVLGGAASFFGVLQSNTLGATAEETGVAESKDIDITTLGDNSLIVDCIGPSSGVHSAHIDQTEIVSNTNRVSSYKVSGLAGADNMSWTSTATANYAMVAAEFKAADSTTDYETDGSRTSPPLSLNAITKAGDTNIEWTSTEPANTDIKVYTAVNSSAVTEPSFPAGYTEATSGSSISTISADEDLTGKYLWVRQELTTTATSATPRLTMLAVSIADAIFTILLTDTFTTTEQIFEKKIKFFKEDFFIIGEITAKGFFKKNINEILLSELVQSKIEAIRFFVDSVNLQEDTSINSKKFLEEFIQLEDFLSQISIGINRSLEDSFVLEEFLKSFVVNKALIDNIQLFENEALIINANRSLTDNIQLFDNLTKRVNKFEFSQLSVEETVFKKIMFNLSDSLALAEENVKKMDLVKRDNFSFLDALSLTTTQIIRDFVILSESIKFDIDKKILDVIVLNDFISKEFNMSLQDSLNLIDDIVTVIIFAVCPFDNFILEDNSLLEIKLKKEEIISVLDELTRKTETFKLNSDQIILTDQTFKELRLLKEDLASLIDNLSRKTESYLLLEEQFELSDAFSFSKNISLSDLIFFSILLKKDISLSKQDFISIDDRTVKKLDLSALDQFELMDDIRKTVFLVKNGLIEIEDEINFSANLNIDDLINISDSFNRKIIFNRVLDDFIILEAEIKSKDNIKQIYDSFDLSDFSITKTNIKLLDSTELIEELKFSIGMSLEDSLTLLDVLTKNRVGPIGKETYLVSKQNKVYLITR